MYGKKTKGKSYGSKKTKKKNYGKKKVSPELMKQVTTQNLLCVKDFLIK